MDEKLLRKMIRNCLLQYNHDDASIPLRDADYKQLCLAIFDEHQRNKKAELFEIVQDVVYDYLTAWS